MKATVYRHSGKRLHQGLLALVLAGLTAAGWAQEMPGHGMQKMLQAETPADTTVECPDLRQPCTAMVKGKPVKISSDGELVPGKQFVLSVEGEATSARAVWRMLAMDMGPNNYRLVSERPGILQAKVILPQCPHGGKNWQLRLELDTGIAHINTRVR